MNYIQHLNEILAEIYTDKRLLPSHISLYLSLFFYWNLHRFPKEFYANRRELMKMSKIGSKSSYHRLLRQLEEWGYLKYEPSRSPKALSMVKLYHTRTDIGTVTERTRVIYRTYCPIGVPHTLYNKHYKQNKRSLGAKPKSQLEVLDFFKSKKYEIDEAFKFFNHYKAIGWKIGGKIPIQDWTAVAENWMLKAKELSRKNGSDPNTSMVRKSHGDHLITAKEKDYGQPL
jgi:hypothetical protein